MKGDIQRVQIVKGKEEKIANLACICLSIGLIYYSLHPQKAEQHYEYLDKKITWIRKKVKDWQGMNDTLRAIWDLDETQEPK